MTTQIQIQPENLLDENFNPEEMHPADLAQIIEAGKEEYENFPKFTKLRKQYRDVINWCIDTLTEKRGFTQFNHL